MLIVTWDAFGVFTRTANIFQFPVDMFSVKSQTRIKIYIGHDTLMNQVHHAIERNCLLEFITTIWDGVDFREPDTVNCELCGIIKRTLP